MTDPLLSILIPGLISRRSYYVPRILDQLQPQVDRHPEVELSVLLETRTRSIGAARNALMDTARGRYLAFVDDDDQVSARYVRSIMGAIRAHPDVDVITFDILKAVDGISLPKMISAPWIWHVWRAALARQVRYPDSSYAEDYEWTQRIRPLIATQARIDETLYFAQMSYTWSESQRPRGWRGWVYRRLHAGMKLVNDSHTAYLTQRGTRP